MASSALRGVRACLRLGKEALIKAPEGLCQLEGRHCAHGCKRLRRRLVGRIKQLARLPAHTKPHPEHSCLFGQPITQLRKNFRVCFLLLFPLCIRTRFTKSRDKKCQVSQNLHCHS